MLYEKSIFSKRKCCLPFITIVCFWGMVFCSLGCSWTWCVRTTLNFWSCHSYLPGIDSTVCAVMPCSMCPWNWTQDLFHARKTLPHRGNLSPFIYFSTAGLSHPGLSAYQASSGPSSPDLKYHTHIYHAHMVIIRDDGEWVNQFELIISQYICISIYHILNIILVARGWRC